MNTIKTQRLILRPWKESDAPALYTLAKDGEVGPRAGWEPHKNIEESLDVIQKIFSNDCTWAITLKDNGELIGCIGYYTYHTSNIEIGINDAEVGYWIGKEFWNKGFCTEALMEIIDFCFNKKKFDILWADFFVDNPASGRVMEKCGFIDTGRINECSHLFHSKDRPIKIMQLNKTPF